MENDNFASNLPENFRRSITEIFGEAGHAWLVELPSIIERISEKWSLKAEKHFLDLSYNYVAPCVLCDGRKAVLKIGFPKNKASVSRENKILKIFDGEGIVKALDFDEENCALLMERLLPGENLKKICKADDRKANQTAIEIMRKLWREPPVSTEIVTLDKWMRNFVEAENFQDETAQVFSKGRDFYRELLESSNQKILLHGDFHHENVLSAQREPFLAIDPRGIIGDIGYEISIFLNNPRSWILEHPDSKKILTNRIVQSSEAFEIEPKTLYQWASALPALAAFWSLQDKSSDWTKWSALTEIWENVNF